jgi:hypothetical protein
MIGAFEHYELAVAIVNDLIKASRTLVQTQGSELLFQSPEAFFDEAGRQAKERLCSRFLGK